MFAFGVGCKSVRVCVCVISSMDRKLFVLTPINLALPLLHDVWFVMPRENGLLSIR